MKQVLLAIVLATVLLGAQADPLEGVWQGYDGEWLHVSRQLVSLAETGLSCSGCYPFNKLQLNQ